MYDKVMAEQGEKLAELREAATHFITMVKNLSKEVESPMNDLRLRDRRLSG